MSSSCSPNSFRALSLSRSVGRADSSCPMLVWVCLSCLSVVGPFITALSQPYPLLGHPVVPFSTALSGYRYRVCFSCGYHHYHPFVFAHVTPGIRNYCVFLTFCTPFPIYTDITTNIGVQGLDAKNTLKLFGSYAMLCWKSSNPCQWLCCAKIRVVPLRGTVRPSWRMDAFACWQCGTQPNVDCNGRAGGSEF